MTTQTFLATLLADELRARYMLPAARVQQEKKVNGTVVLSVNVKSADKSVWDISIELPPVIELVEVAMPHPSSQHGYGIKDGVVSWKRTSADEREGVTTGTHMLLPRFFINIPSFAPAVLQ